MSDLHLTNRHLPAIANLLADLELAGAASRARTRLRHCLTGPLEALGAAEMELAKTYAVLDADEQIMLEADGSFALKNPEDATRFATEHQELLEETVIVPPTYTEQYPLLTNALLAYKGTFAGGQAEAYDVLCTALEHATVQTGEGK